MSEEIRAKLADAREAIANLEKMAKDFERAGLTEEARGAQTTATELKARLAKLQAVYG